MSIITFKIDLTPTATMDDDSEQVERSAFNNAKPAVSWRHEMKPLFNFFMIIGLFMIGIYFYLRNTAGSKEGLPAVHCGLGSLTYRIKAGDTCWAIAQTSGSSVDALLEQNKGLNCDMLTTGQTICVAKT
jgi:hypothetical protein